MIVHTYVFEERLSRNSYRCIRFGDARNTTIYCDLNNFKYGREIPDSLIVSEMSNSNLMRANVRSLAKKNSIMSKCTRQSRNKITCMYVHIFKLM